MSTNYDGLTRTTWPGTWSPNGDQPIVIDRELRGSLQYISGDVGDRLTDITGQRLQEGMMVYLKAGYTSGSFIFKSNTYYQYRPLVGESRDAATGALPNNDDNWLELSLAANTATGSNLEFLTVENFRIQPLAGPDVEFITSIVNVINTATANSTTLPTTYAVKVYVDEKTSNVNITTGSISNVTIANLVSPITANSGGTGLTSFSNNGVLYANSNLTLNFATGNPGEVLQIGTNDRPTFGILDGGNF
jgi:hypothetical protein